MVLVRGSSFPVFLPVPVAFGAFLALPGRHLAREARACLEPKDLINLIIEMVAIGILIYAILFSIGPCSHRSAIRMRADIDRPNLLPVRLFIAVRPPGPGLRKGFMS